MGEPFPWIAADLAELEAAGLRRRRREVRPLPDGACEIDGRRLWSFASNDYLGLAHDTRVLDAARAAIDDSGLGARASALVVGRTEWHARLEQALASFEGQESGILFPTGYAANAGTIAALVGGSDIVFCDRLNHASLVDGCRLSGAKLRVYRHTTLIDAKTYKPDAPARDEGESPSLARRARESHARLETLERELRKTAGFRRRLIVTESVFSMDGDVAPLRELCDLAERFAAEVLVDEAHGTGVFGEHGRGACEVLGVEDRVAVRVGTLGKAIGTLGGFVTGPQRLIDWLWNKARPQVFSTALPPAVCAAACAAIEVIERDAERRQRLWRNCEFVRTELARRGLAVLAGSEGPIIPIVLGSADAVVAAQAELEARGCLVAAIRPPTVPHGTSRLRISLSAAHNDQCLRCLVEALGQIAKSSPAVGIPPPNTLPAMPTPTST